MKRAIFLLLVGSLVVLKPSFGAATTPEVNATEVMERNFYASKVSTLQVESTMQLINDRGQQRTRKNTTVIKLQPNGLDSKFLVKFSTPADIKGTGFLQVEHIEGEDDLWIYLPALKKSRRLVANNKKDSFAGSDFSYGDISLPKVELYTHRYLRTEKLGDTECHVIESVPINDAVKANSGYSKKTSWVRTDNFLEAKVEYMDLAGRLLKTQLTSRHQLVEPDKSRWFALNREMVNHQTGHRTVISGEKWDAAVSTSDDLFTTRYLERE